MRRTKIAFLGFIAMWALMMFAAVVADAQDMNWGTQPDTNKVLKIQLFGQLWARYNQSNPGTMAFGESAESTFDIGIRRARIQAFAQITDRASLFLHFGFNNYNSTFATGSNRRIQAFFHDVFAEYRLTQGNELKVGAGLAFVNGLSRFSQPAVIAMPTMDIPIFAQATVEQIDVFGRKLSLTARGQIGPIDYRFALSDPFPVTTNGQTLPPIGTSANFAQVGHSLQKQAFIIYQFRDHEPHQISNMAGTYYGTRNVFNIAAGVMHQPRAMWRTLGADTVYEDLLLMAVETMYDAPIDRLGTSVSAYVGFFHNNYGRNYLRYNAAMNPGTSLEANSDSTKLKPLTQYGPAFGNTYPMFGTGNVVYSHVGVYFPKVMGNVGVMPYMSTTQAWYNRLDNQVTDIYALGCSLLMDGIRSRVTLEIQNRPTFGMSVAETPFGELVKGERRNQIALQYQVVW